jgi:hypothetical protein
LTYNFQNFKEVRVPQRQRVLVALVALLLLLPCTAGQADSDPAELPSVQGQPYQFSPEEEISTKGPTIPRNMVLLETFGRPT